jgi:hypothetical protein
VLSDGRDNSSFVTAAHVVEVAKASSAVLCIALVQSSNPLVREAGGIDAVDPMSEQSTVVVPGAAAKAPPPGVTLMRSDIGASIAVTRTAGPYAGGPNTAALRNAAGATGGFLYTDSTRTPVPQLFRRILDDFRAGYVLTYSPTGVNRPGTHALTVRMKNKAYTVRARRSYEQK